MTFSKATWQIRGLGLPRGVALARPISRKATSPLSAPSVLLVGDALAVALAPPLKRALSEVGFSLVGPVVHRPVGQPPTSHVVFAFAAPPVGAPAKGWQLPIATSHRSPPSRLLWVDVSAEGLLDSDALRAAARKAGVEVVKPSEKVLRRAPNGGISAVGIAGLAGLVGTWVKHSASDQKRK